jgi:hypothetical protein
MNIQIRLSCPRDRTFFLFSILAYSLAVTKGNVFVARIHGFQ